MAFWELILISLALATDAAAVSISNTMCYPNMRKRYFPLIPFSFALFQGVMPLLGYFLLRKVDFGNFTKVIIFAIFLFLGGRMIYEALIGSKKKNDCPLKFTPSVLLLQSLSTSIDAFAVGVSFTATETNPLSASAIIFVVTLIVCVVAITIGAKLQKILGSNATLLGGIILIILAIKALVN